MSKQVDAVYENGVLKPLQPLDLAEHEHVVISVTRGVGTLDASHLALDYVESVRKRLEGAAPAPGKEEIRRRLSKIPGNLSDDFIALRGDR